MLVTMWKYDWVPTPSMGGDRAQTDYALQILNKRAMDRWEVVLEMESPHGFLMKQEYSAVHMV